MQIPRGYQKKKFTVAFPEAKKGVLNFARMRTGPITMQIPWGYQKKKFIV